MHCYQTVFKEKVLEIYRFQYEPVDSNMFFIPIDDEGIVIDPNINEELLFLLQKKNIKKIHILLTHEHYDHTCGVSWLQQHVESTLFCQENCAKSISSKRGNNPQLVAFVLATKDSLDGGHRYDEFKKTCIRYTLKADDCFVKKSTINLGGIIIECVSTPGHTPGSACYIIGREIVFTGDSLIQNTPTITRLPESDREEYIMRTVPFLKSLDKNILVYPGHGEPFKIFDAKYL